MFFTYLFNIYGISTIGASATGSYINTQRCSLQLLRWCLEAKLTTGLNYWLLY